VGMVDGSGQTSPVFWNCLSRRSFQKINAVYGVTPVLLSNHEAVKRRQWNFKFERVQTFSSVVPVLGAIVAHCKRHCQGLMAASLNLDAIRFASYICLKQSTKLKLREHQMNGIGELQQLRRRSFGTVLTDADGMLMREREICPPPDQGQS
jgi:hypothetical protein